MKTRRIALILAIAATLLSLTAAADATGRCEVRIDRQTGDVSVVC